MSWVEGEGPVPCKYMIVAEAPADNEIKQGRPLVGATGRELMSYLKGIGMIREEVYLTNVIKRQLEEGNKAKTIPAWEMELMSDVLRDEIAAVNPSHILALGAISTHWFLGASHDMDTMNGIPHQWEGRTVTPCLHPAAAFRDPSKMAWVREGIQAWKGVVDGHLPVWSPAPKTRLVPFAQWVRQERADASLLALDTETYRSGAPYMIQASCKVGEATWVMADDFDSVRLLKSLIPLFNTILLHNAMFDVPVLEKAGVHLTSWYDTMVMAFLLQTLPQGLKDLAYKLCGMEMMEYADVVAGRGDLSNVPEAERLAYACADPDATLQVYGAMCGIAKQRGYTNIHTLVHTDTLIQPMVNAMMDNGLPADKEEFEKLDVELSLRNIELQNEIEKYAGAGPWPKGKFNPGSSQQVSKLVYSKLGTGRTKRIERTKSGRWSADKKNLAKVNTEHAVVPLIEQWRETDTLIDKYVRVLPKLVRDDGRIHAKLSMTRIVHSGRMAATKPNVLAQPTRNSDGKRIRDCYRAPDGWVFASFDYSGIEMRCVAHESQDSKMLEVFRNNGDIHTQTASWMFGIKEEDVDSMAHRYPAKRVGFGVVYGITAMGLARELNATPGVGWWTEERAQEAIDLWFDVYRGVKAYMDATMAKARRTGQVVDMWGRTLLVPEVWSVFPHIREGGLRKAVNMTIQAGAQGVIKAAMVDVWRWLVGSGMGEYIKPLLQIHDDLLNMVDESAISIAIPTIRDIMEHVVKLSIPTPVDPKVGVTWGKMEKWNEGGQS